MREVDSLIGKARQSQGAARTLSRDGYTDLMAWGRLDDVNGAP